MPREGEGEEEELGLANLSHLVAAAEVPEVRSLVLMAKATAAAVAVAVAVAGHLECLEERRRERAAAVMKGNRQKVEQQVLLAHLTSVGLALSLVSEVGVGEPLP
jgi:hypothetical protein